MASMKRHKTTYPGVYYLVNKDKEKVYYIRYRKNGKSIDEKVGKQHTNDMTPARASGIRADRMQGKEKSNTEKRAEKVQTAAEWTIDRLWKEYRKQLPNSAKADDSRYRIYLEKKFGNKKPKEIVQLDLDRLRINLLKKRAPQTVKHVLTLFKRIVNFGADRGLISPLLFKIKMPNVDNLKTEDLSPEELQRLIKVLEATPYQTAATMMKIALYTGMRRGEIFKLQWADIDHHRGFIHIRNPKGGKSQKIPLSSNVEAVFKGIPENESDYIFPARNGGPRKSIRVDLAKIKKEARLPTDFRPMHGLRHLYATMLANSGKVDMYTLQKLLTHKSPQMTQRYAHLRDDAMRRASNQIDNILSESLKLEDKTKIKAIK